jgi:hypothetical protein
MPQTGNRWSKTQLPFIQRLPATPPFRRTRIACSSKADWRAKTAKLAVDLCKLSQPRAGARALGQKLRCPARRAARGPPPPSPRRTRRAGGRPPSRQSATTVLELRLQNIIAFSLQNIITMPAPRAQPRRGDNGPETPQKGLRGARLPLKWRVSRFVRPVITH